MRGNIFIRMEEVLDGHSQHPARGIVFQLSDGTYFHRGDIYGSLDDLPMLEAGGYLLLPMG